MAKHGARKLRPGKSSASYPTLAHALLDRRTFLAGVAVATLGACTDEGVLDGVPSDASYAEFDALPDAEVMLDGLPAPPDAGADAEPADDGGLADAREPDADTSDGGD